jgi:hypothetical protein
MLVGVLPTGTSVPLPSACVFQVVVFRVLPVLVNAGIVAMAGHGEPYVHVVLLGGAGVAAPPFALYVTVYVLAVHFA